MLTGERVRGVSEECEEEVRLRSAVATTTGVGEYSAPNMIILSRVQCRAEVITSDALNMFSVGRVSCYYQLLPSLILFHFLDYILLWPVILKVNKISAYSHSRSREDAIYVITYLTVPRDLGDIALTFVPETNKILSSATYQPRA